jgi:hypothetical protein
LPYKYHPTPVTKGEEGEEKKINGRKRKGKQTREREKEREREREREGGKEDEFETGECLREKQTGE